MFLFRDLSKVSAAAAALASALLLTACGGGEQKETFQPTRIIALGDENSLIVSGTGRQYTLNNTVVSAASPTGIACQNNAVWVQYVAADYGLPFAECGGAATERTNALMRATNGGTVATVQAAINTINASAAPINSNDLVTMMVGTHDLLEIMGTNLNPTAAQLSAMGDQAEARGVAAGGLVQQIVARGARILFTTIPDLGTAPIAVTGYTNGGYNPAALHELSFRFIEGLNLGSVLPNGGGRNGAVLQVDSLINVYRNNADQYTSFTNRIAPACTTGSGTTLAIMDDAALPTDCIATSTTDTTRLYYLWSGRVQFGTYTHGLLGQEAVARIRANPL